MDWRSLEAAHLVRRCIRRPEISVFGAPERRSGQLLGALGSGKGNQVRRIGGQVEQPCGAAPTAPAVGIPLCATAVDVGVASVAPHGVAPVARWIGRPHAGRPTATPTVAVSDQPLACEPSSDPRQRIPGRCAADHLVCAGCDRRQQPTLLVVNLDGPQLMCKPQQHGLVSRHQDVFSELRRRRNPLRLNWYSAVARVAHAQRRPSRGSVAMVPS